MLARAKRFLRRCFRRFRRPVVHLTATEAGMQVRRLDTRRVQEFRRLDEATVYLRVERG